MGQQWLNEIVGILTEAGIRADEAFPGSPRMELTGPVAGVSLRDLCYKDRTGFFEVRIISPRRLGGWACQTTAASAVAALEEGGYACRLEPMDYDARMDCFEMKVICQKFIFDAEETPVSQAFSVNIGGENVGYVTEFSGTQDRQRRLIGAFEERTPKGITPPTGGWRIRMVQVIPMGGQLFPEPAEPFSLMVQEQGLVTTFSGCGWNVVKKQMDQEKTRLEWEGFALTREETANG